MRTRPTGTWVNGAYAYAADGQLARRRARRGSTSDEAAARPRAALAARVRARHQRPTCSGGRAGPVALTRDALADCGAVEVDLDDGPGWVAPGTRPPSRPAGPWVAAAAQPRPDHDGLEGARLVPPDDACADAFDRMGNAGPTIWVDGQVVGGWAQAPDGELRTRYFLDVPARTRGAAGSTSAAEVLARLLGDDPVHGALPQRRVGRAARAQARRTARPWPPMASAPHPLDAGARSTSGPTPSRSGVGTSATVITAVRTVASVVLAGLAAAQEQPHRCWSSRWSSTGSATASTASWPASAAARPGSARSSTSFATGSARPPSTSGWCGCTGVRRPGVHLPRRVHGRRLLLVAGLPGLAGAQPQLLLRRRPAAVAVELVEARQGRQLLAVRGAAAGHRLGVAGRASSPPRCWC